MIRAAPPGPAPGAFGTRIEDLAWIGEFAARVRSHVRVRPEDGVLIKVPAEVHGLSPTGVRLLSRALRGDPVAAIAADEGALDRPERLHAIHAFFCDVRDLLSGRLGDGTGRLATRVSRYARSPARYPVLSEFAVTWRCNLACSFCYASCGGAAGRAGGELDTAGALRVIDALARDALVPSVSFTGGECTLRADLPELVARAADRGLRVNLITNGVRLADPALAVRLAAAGLASAQVSVEGPDAATHDALVARPGAFERALRGIGNLAAAGVAVHAHTTVCAGNRDRLGGMVDLALRLGLPRLSMNMLIPTGSAGRPPNRALRVRYDGIGPLVLAVRDPAERAGVAFHWYSPTPLCLFNPVAEGLGNKGCAACDGLLHVSPTGDVLPCSSWLSPVGNLLRDGFAKVWSGRRARYHREKRHAPRECRDCEDFALCQGACPLYWAAMGKGELIDRVRRREEVGDGAPARS